MIQRVIGRVKPSPPALKEEGKPEGYYQLAIAAWLDEKHKHTGSDKTVAAYGDTMREFRDALHQANMELDRAPEGVASAIQGWVGIPWDQGKRHEVRPATYNQRLAILSSFYQFAMRRYRFPANPVLLIERAKVQRYAGARALDSETASAALEAIDRTSMEGRRDYALLAIALTTGRRVTELASLRWGHVLRTAGRGVTLHFAQAKGGKEMYDALAPEVADALLDWLQSFYGNLHGLRLDTPVWTALSRNREGKPLTVQGLADICLKRLGTSKFHTTRHTFAHEMEKAGAKASDIQARLGHNDLATTGIYLAQLRREENIYAPAVAAQLGIRKR